VIERRAVAGEWPNKCSPGILSGTVLDREYATRVPIVPSREVFWGSKGELRLHN
jgi:hypothetical protein